MHARDHHSQSVVSSRCQTQGPGPRCPSERTPHGRQGPCGNHHESPPRHHQGMHQEEGSPRGPGGGSLEKACGARPKSPSEPPTQAPAKALGLRARTSDTKIKQIRGMLRGRGVRTRAHAGMSGKSGAKRKSAERQADHNSRRLREGEGPEHDADQAPARGTRGRILAPSSSSWALSLLPGAYA